jgi:hypothetical protein
MERSGTTPPGALRAQDQLAGLARVARSDGPFASVYLGVSPDAVDAAHRLDVRWREARHDLERQGAPAPVIEAIAEVVERDDHRGGATLAVLADESGRRIVSELPNPPKRDVVAWAPLPRLGPLVEWRQAELPHVVVLIDRSGADVFGVVGETEAVHEDVQGDSAPIEKNAPGGWSQKRYQTRAESSWSENAADVARVVEETCARIDAKLVVVAGDVRAVELLRKSLPSRVDELVTVIDGSRHADGSEDAVAEDTVRAVATVVASETATLLAKFREELGQHDRAADGPGPVLEALARGQVEVLLVHDDPDDNRTAWFGPDPLHVGARRDVVEAMGVDAPCEGRLVDVLLRAALGSGAGIRIVPDSRQLDGRVGAILRWSD